MDCPICMDVIEMNKNCITTECGHCFHASCLMKSIAHTGFGCPYCRTAMAEVENIRGHHVIEDDEDDDDYLAGDDEEIFDDYALRGFRFFWNNINEEEIDEEDDADEEQEDEWVDDADAGEEDENIPSPQYVADKLKRQGVTYDELVHLLLYKDHEEYDNDDNDAVDRLDGQVFGKIRIIVSNYQPEAPAQAQAEAEAEAEAQAADFEAQSKTTTRGRMTIEELM